MYLRVPGPRGVAPRSKFGQWLTVAGVSMPHGRIPIETLRFKLWRVEVIDAQRDYLLRPLRTPYSVVSRVLERLS